jgi:hypothetical protein
MSKRVPRGRRLGRALLVCGLSAPVVAVRDAAPRARADAPRFATSSHGPFGHVDGRGNRARWELS